MTQRCCPPLYLCKSNHVAEELTLLDGETLRKITPSEIQGGAWMDKQRKNDIAPNVMAMVRSFNRIALLVPTEILEEAMPQGRAKVISKYIKIAMKCYKLKNYNSLKAILAGLHSEPVHRLDKTWKHVSTNKKRALDQLTRLMSEEDNLALYYEDLELQWSTRTPCIPFLGHYLTQVVFSDSYRELKGKKTLVAQKSTTVYTELSAVTVPDVLSSASAANGKPKGCSKVSSGNVDEPFCIPRAGSGSWEEYMRHQKSFKEPVIHPLQRHRAMSDRCTPDRQDDSSRESSPDLDDAVTAQAMRRKKWTAPLLLNDAVGVGDPVMYLYKMQLNSLGCCSGLEPRPAVRELITASNHNTEAENYKLSCLREPVQI